MKINAFKKFVALLIVFSTIISLLGAISVVFADSDEGNGTPAVTRLALTEQDKTLLGYGYNVTSGKPLSRQSLLHQSPILDVNNPELVSKFFVDEFKRVNAEHQVAYSSREMAEKIGTGISGGINAKISVVSTDINALFNKEHSLSNAVQERYEIYYEEILARKVVIQGVTKEELRGYLSEQFIKDGAAVKNVEDAKKFISKYGTHLFTGYELGGRLDVTNYKVSNAMSDNLNQTVSLEAQVAAGVKSASGKTSFSITEQYGKAENNEHQKSMYDCTIVGGEAPAALTVDHLFTYHSSIVDGKGNYEYARWIYSINEGKNLEIMGAAESTMILPIWELFPSNIEYQLVRTKLIEAYAELCGDKYNEYMSAYPFLDSDIVISDDEEDDTVGEISNFSYLSSSTVVGPFAVDNDTEYKVVSGSNIYLSSEDNIDLSKKNWKLVGGNTNAAILDDKNGVVQVTGAVGNSFVVALCSGEMVLDQIQFKVAKKDFDGGTGTAADPYLISTPKQMQELLNNPDWYANSNLYFMLTSDIDGSNIVITRAMTTSSSFFLPRLSP